MAATPSGRPTARKIKVRTSFYDRLQRFLGVHPEVIAHDLHPDYASNGLFYVYYTRSSDGAPNESSAG